MTPITAWFACQNMANKLSCILPITAGQHVCSTLKRSHHYAPRSELLLIAKVRASGDLRVLTG